MAASPHADRDERHSRQLSCVELDRREHQPIAREWIGFVPRYSGERLIVFAEGRARLVTRLARLLRPPRNSYFFIFALAASHSFCVISTTP